MMGHRGCRLDITYPEIAVMQTKAIINAAIKVQKSGKKVKLELMIPLVVDLEEFKYLGGVRREGYYQGEETPYFDGIEMQTKEKEKGQKLTLTEKKDNNKIISTWY